MATLLYVASNPSVRGTLELHSEISAIQAQLTKHSDYTSDLRTIFLPDLNAASLAEALEQHRPDILHFAAHGSERGLVIKPTGGEDESATLRAEALDKWLPTPAPRLVFVNACRSELFAQELVKLGKVRVAIGTDADIQHGTARAAALIFYLRLFSGSTIKAAFEACRSMAAFEQPSLNMVLKTSFPKAEELVLRAGPSLLAKFIDENPRRSEGKYAFRLGITSCPSQTSQVIFFTDDETLG
jgi:hypothetical protein